MGADVEVGKNGPTIFAVIGITHKGGKPPLGYLPDQPFPIFYAVYFFWIAIKTR
jgi:hypothetical protein